MTDMTKVAKLGEKLSDDLAYLADAIELGDPEDVIKSADEKFKKTLEEMYSLYKPLAEAYKEMYEHIKKD